jgi:hypothetical protein
MPKLDAVYTNTSFEHRSCMVDEVLFDHLSNECSKTTCPPSVRTIVVESTHRQRHLYLLHKVQNSDQANIQRIVVTLL